MDRAGRITSLLTSVLHGFHVSTIALKTLQQEILSMTPNLVIFGIGWIIYQGFLQRLLPTRIQDRLLNVCLTSMSVIAVGVWLNVAFLYGVRKMGFTPSGILRGSWASTVQSRQAARRPMVSRLMSTLQAVGADGKFMKDTMKLAVLLLIGLALFVLVSLLCRALL